MDETLITTVEVNLIPLCSYLKDKRVIFFLLFSSTSALTFLGATISFNSVLCFENLHKEMECHLSKKSVVE